MKSRLEIDGTNVGFKSILPISVNMSVADIREPDKRNSSYSKTISIPGSAIVNQIFEYAFEINIESSSFNPNLKTPASYYVNEVKVFNGDLQLLKIKKRTVGTSIELTYECSIVGETGNLFLDIASLFLTDLDFSDLDHTLTYSSGLFNPTLGTGYCYPYIDYGVNTLSVPNSGTWTFEHLKPAIFEKEYIDRIFAAAGYTYTSNYLTSTYAKSIIIPDVGEGRLKMPDQDILDNLFYAGRTTTSTINYSGVWNGPSINRWVYRSNTDKIDPIPINNDSSGGFFDGANNTYSTVTSTFTPQVDAVYNLLSNLYIELAFTVPAGTYQGSANLSFTYKMERSLDGGSTWAIIQSSNYTYNTINIVSSGVADPNKLITCGLNYPPTLVNITSPGNVVFKCTLQFISFRAGYLDNTLATISTGSTSVAFKITPGTTFGNQIPYHDLPYGSPVVMNNTVPTEVKQLDFLTSIIKAENLYVEVDKDDPTNYIIEPREDFIQETNPLEWTKKQDLSKETEIIPMGDLDAKRYRFTYKSDKDFFNEQYENEFKEVYGSETIDVDTDFVKGEKVISLIFSATPTAGNNINDIVAPQLYKSDNEARNPIKPLKCNIRRLYWGGLLPCQDHSLVVNGISRTVSEYPFCGHVDDPTNPTLDLCFDEPRKLYWAFLNQFYTDNNRYNERYSKFISEITDRDSKIMVSYFRLNERDISEFSFRKIVFVDGAYFFVNKIMDYDPQEEKTIPVELLKLKKGITFSPNIVDLDDETHPNGSSRQMPGFNYAGNYSSSNGVSYGQNNINNGTNSFISGEGNYIG